MQGRKTLKILRALIVNIHRAVYIEGLCLLVVERRVRMKSEQAMIHILQEQVKTYQKLLDLLMKEKECLVNIQPDIVSELSKAKDTVVMRLRLLEEERARLVREFAADNNVSADINLRDIAELTGDNTFTVLRSKLVSLLQNVEEMNKFNSILIDRSINYIRTTNGFLSSFKKESSPKRTGVLLSKES